MKLAGVQCDVALGQPDKNLERIEEFINQTATEGADLTVFPECALTGYCFESEAEALPHAQTIPGPFTDRLATMCERHQTHVVCGLLEIHQGKLFNTAVLVGPQNQVHPYRKIHLPFLGVDRFTTPGDRPFAVHSAGKANVGMNICYDGSFPESARCLTLLGADVVAMPTNWPQGAQCAAQNIASCRAMENGVYFIVVNRIGTEGDFSFIGQSQICDPGGKTIYRASENREEVFFADIDPNRARQKHVVRVPQKHEIHRLADRRPALYQPLTQTHTLTPPGRPHPHN
ncbi:MAG: carbon-nitrogen hydrolase family protein [Pirellulaceae bacterium]|nr:carbon-nitrogen hydrolase family protein [Pirellulaceae bacterium]